jgi:hypothetical protein
MAWIISVHQEQSSSNLRKRHVQGKRVVMCAVVGFTYTFLPWDTPRTKDCQQDPSVH